MDQGGFSDREIIEGIERLDRTIISWLYQYYTPEVKERVIKRKGTKQEAKDLVHTVIVILYNNIKRGKYTYNPKVGFEAYFMQVCRYTWWNGIKRGQKHHPFDEQLHEAHISEQNNAMEKQDKEAKFASIFYYLKKLGPSCQQIIKKFYSGASHEEIAQELNISPKFSRKRKHDCMQALKRIIQEDPDQMLKQIHP